MLTTYSDIVLHLQAYLGDRNATLSKAYCKRAAADALREIANIHSWSYYRQLGRFTTAASYSTGTVVYDHTGGAFERMLTLSGGTWPEWIQYGVVKINDVPYDVDERKSDTVITLTRMTNPGADVASTSYSTYRDTYPAPVDFQSVETAVVLDRDVRLQYVTPQQWVAGQRQMDLSGNVWYFTIMGDPNYQGAMSFRLCGSPSTAETIDFLYRRRPRTLRYHEVNAGTVTVEADSQTVSGSGTAFSGFMVGSVIRLYDTASGPTNEEGHYPAYVERTIIGVASTVSLTVDAEIPDAYTGVKYMISDPIDIDKQSMLGAYKRTCEKLVETQRQGKNLPAVQAAWMGEVQMAIAADKRYAGGGVARGGATGLEPGLGLGDIGTVVFD